VPLIPNNLSALKGAYIGFMYMYLLHKKTAARRQMLLRDHLLTQCHTKVTMPDSMGMP
jgi:hypothetical protein